MIRAAVPSDAARIAELGERFFNEAGWPQVATWHEDSVRDFLGVLSAHGVLLVAEVGGVVVGMAGACIFPAYFNRDLKMAQELFWYVEEAHRKGKAIGAELLRAMEDAAKAKGAVVVIMSSVAKLRSEALDRLYGRDGYRPSEITYIKRVA